MDWTSNPESLDLYRTIVRTSGFSDVRAVFWSFGSETLLDTQYISLCGEDGPQGA